ncbi:hypothetical protein BRD00_14765 [Halobacteriales archaeon QS_8_69_26]|nr:MAG: hypothetical protein BRD00_14765 [Halobacteriales archaeon QS_8_69_26]
MNTEEYGREIGFGVGTFVGVLLFALGVSFVILFLSVGLREGSGTYLTQGQRDVLIYGGIALATVGFLVRLYRSKLTLSNAVGKYAGTGAFFVGTLLLSTGFSRGPYVSAPFLTTPGQKFVLLAIAVVFLVVGLLVTRASARLVGW